MTINKPLLAVLLCSPLLMLAAAGCPSSNDGGGSCGAGGVAPCGGDIVGTWRVTDSCLSVSGDGSRAFCARVPMSMRATAEGTITYAADGSFVQTGTGDLTVELHFPASCLGAGAAALTCADVEAMERNFEPDFYDALTCRAETGGCVCNGMVNDVTADDAGTWQTNGNRLTMTNEDGEIDESEYCVSGGQLHQRWTNYVLGGLMGAGSVTHVKQ